MYISIKDGKINPVDELPDIANLHPFNGLHYCDGETTLPNGRKSLHWQKCELFSDEEVKSEIRPNKDDRNRIGISSTMLRCTRIVKTPLCGYTQR